MLSPLRLEESVLMMLLHRMHRGRSSEAALEEPAEEESEVVDELLAVEDADKSLLAGEATCIGCTFGLWRVGWCAT